MTGMMKGLRGDTLSGIGQALRTSIAVPTDTMITDDIPLMLTKLSRVAAVSVADGDRPDAASMVADAPA